MTHNLRHGESGMKSEFPRQIMLNIEDFRKAAEDGLLKRQVRGSFELFNYTNETTFARKWTDTTLEGRGIVFQDGQVVCRPMRKFFNSHEPDVCEGFAPSLALVKLDGTLINAWFDLQGELHVSTRGSLDNEYIDGAWKLIKKYNLEVMLTPHKDVTWSFEYTYPQDRFSLPSVIPHNTERLTLLNMRTRDGGELDAGLMPECNIALYDNSEAFYDLFVPMEENLLERMQELAKILPYTDEGWVLSYFDGKLNHRVKVKGTQYVAMHRVIHGMTPRAVGDAWCAGMSEELCDMLYEPHASLLREKFDVYDEAYQVARKEVVGWIDGFVKVNEEFTRKEFVLQAQEDLSEYWQLAIRQQYTGLTHDDLSEWVMKKMTGKPPRKWELPTTDDTPD